MRIAYLNVWGADSSEHHTGFILKIVAERLGVEIIPCRNSADVDAANPDYTILLSRTQAKLTRHPTYMVLNEPSTVYFREPGLLNYMLSFDGYFALADSLTLFLKHALYGIRRKEDPGVYYNSAHRMDEVADVATLLRAGHARLTYFGTNWDGRRAHFFHQFGHWGEAEIYGPQRTWAHQQLPSYKGEVPFDGVSAQRVYVRTGVGLNILADHHLHEDVISNRVFEISSVGAACVSCDMPWLRRHFGDSLYYFEQEATDARVLEQLKDIMAHMRAHPLEAQEKARAARQIFEKQFSLDVLVQNTIDYHKRKSVKRPRTADPLISVVMLTDGAKAGDFKRTLQSIPAQECGRYQLILVKTKAFDEKPFLESVRAPHIDVTCVDGLGQGGSAPLWAGLKEVKGDFFAVLAEGTEWFPQHISRLLARANFDGDEADFVHSAHVQQHGGPVKSPVPNGETRSVSFFNDVQGMDYMRAAENIPFGGFLARRTLLDVRLLEDPQLEKGAEKYLLMALMARAKPKNDFATTLFSYHPKSSARPALNAEGWLPIMLRLWQDDPHTGAANNLSESMVQQGLRARAYRYETQREEKNGVIYERLAYNRFEPSRLKEIPVPYFTQASFFRHGLTLVEAGAGGMVLHAPEPQNANAVAGFIALPQEEAAPVPQEFLLVLDAEIERGQIGVQLLHNHRTLEQYHVARALFAGRTVLEMPIYNRLEISGLVLELAAQTVLKRLTVKAYVENAVK